jgi:hypothetical protein
MSDAKMTFKSNIPDFIAKHEAAKEMLMSTMSLDMERGIKSTSGTPVDKGQMKASAHQERWINGYRVVVNKEYAEYQERGSREDGTHQITNYTTAGTSAGWFQRAVDSVLGNSANYIEIARRAIGL